MTGGKWLLSAEDIEYMEFGASLLGCGGGGDPNTGRLVALQQLAQGKSITIYRQSFQVFYTELCEHNIGHFDAKSYVASK